MNEAHKIAVKVNRLKRLQNKLKGAPADTAKIDRKNALIYELNKVGVKV